MKTYIKQIRTRILRVMLFFEKKLHFSLKRKFPPSLSLSLSLFAHKIYIFNFGIGISFRLKFFYNLLLKKNTIKMMLNRYKFKGGKEMRRFLLSIVVHLILNVNSKRNRIDLLKERKQKTTRNSNFITLGLKKEERESFLNKYIINNQTKS